MVTKSGVAFVTLTENKKDPSDIFIPRHLFKNAMDGDTVIVELLKQTSFSRGKNEGKIKKVVKRKHTELAGTVVSQDKKLYFRADDPKIPYLFEFKKNNKIKKDIKCVLTILKYPSQNKKPYGEITDVFGKRSDPQTDTKIIMAKYNLPDSFPQNVEKETAQIPSKPTKNDLKGRTDLTKLLTVTIDPKEAKDFDDAISLEKIDKTTWCLYVHIADVSHYIKENSALDKEAYTRATSVYLPGKVIPMLPEKISNGLCSLKPNTIRLAKTIAIEITDEGRIKKSKFINSYIKSDKRLIYGDVLNFLEKKSTKIKDPKLQQLLKNMDKLAVNIKNRRIEKGCLYLNIPEARIKLDEKGFPIAITKEESDRAHSMIEEFMLTANEETAKFIMRRKLPAIFRIHEMPEKDAIDNFITAASNFASKKYIFKNIKTIQTIIEEFKGKPQENIVNLMLLQSLKQAHYSAENKGHFALASKNYTHFTSPIRRYADLIVHRVVFGSLLKKQRKELLENNFHPHAMHISEVEKTAKRAEFNLIDIKKIRFIEKHKNDTLNAIIVSVHAYGCFVQIPEYMVEGLIHIRFLKEDDFLIYDEKAKRLYSRNSKKRFSIGDKIKVQIENLNIDTIQIDFRPA